MFHLETHPFNSLNSPYSPQEIDYRSSSEAGCEKLLFFLNQQLRATVSFTLQDEYPSVFKDTPGGKSLFFSHEGNPISHVAFASRQYVHSLFQLKLGLLGSITTHEAYRKRGLASQLIRQACERLKEEGCVLAILWSDQPDFYRPLGFYRAGLESGFSLSPQTVLSSPRVARPIQKPQDVEGIYRLHQSQAGKIVRDFKEMESLLKIPELKVFVTEHSGQIDSYIAINKGLDFSFTIHEWGGTPEVVMENISYCQRKYFPDSPLNLIAPADPQNQKFSKIAQQGAYGSLGLVKILDSAKLIQVWHSYLKAASLKAKENSFEDEETTLLAILGRDGQNLSQALPLFLWGFDSI